MSNTPTPRTDDLFRGLGNIEQDYWKVLDLARELERENAALRDALIEILDRLEFYVDCLPINKADYLKTLEGEITNRIISNAKAAIDAARKEGAS